MYELKPIIIQCPYCCEQFDSSVDLSCIEGAIEAVQYTEDCYVCCRPILLNLTIDVHGTLTILVQEE